MQKSPEAPYRAKVVETEIPLQPPSHDMPAKREVEPLQINDSRFSVGGWLLISGFASVIGFGVFEAVNFVDTHFSASPITTTVLGGVVGVFLLSLMSLIWGEVKGYRQVEKYISQRPSIHALLQITSHKDVLRAIDKHYKGLAKYSYATLCYRRFTAVVKQDHSKQEVIDLYQQYVTQPICKQAHEVVKKEALASGSLAFISPNHLIQSLMILWISLRTIRRVSQVYGLRPAATGNLKLMKLLAQQLAAQSIFDLATDEMTNQLSGTLAAKLVENTAEAVAAGALNVRLGKTLIKMLEAEG